MLLTMERVMFLRRVPIFRMLEGDDIHHLADLASEIAYPAGSSIFREDEPGDALYIIVEGQVRIFRGQGEEAHTQATLGPADYFGEIAILDGSPRSNTAEATEVVTVLRLSAADFRLAIEENPAIAFGVFQALLQRYRRDLEQEPEQDVSTTSRAPSPTN